MSQDVKYKGPMVPKFAEGEDIDDYLQTYEKLTTVHEWPRNTWATRLAGLITGKVCSAYSRLSPTDSLDYDKVRQAILKRYELTPEAYRTKLHASHKGSDESFAEWGVRVSQFFIVGMRERRSNREAMGSSVTCSLGSSC